MKGIVIDLFRKCSVFMGGSGFVSVFLPLQGSADMVDRNTFDEIWSMATLYEDESNPYIQFFKLRGRYHGQYWDVADGANRQNDWEDRRSRIGFDATFFARKLDVRFDFRGNDEFIDFYDGLVDAYLCWRPREGLSITVGKAKPLIGHYDWLESTNTQPTFERSQIFNQLGVNRTESLIVEGVHDGFSWRMGIYSNDTPVNTADPVTNIPSGSIRDGAFGRFKGGYSYSFGAGYDLKALLDLENADFRLDWLHSEREAGDLVSGKYDDIVSTTLLIKENDVNFVFESFFASGGDDNNTDVFGFFVQPTYDIVPDLIQLVGRYSYAQSEGPVGLVASPRYDQMVSITKGRGDTYHAIYGGVQYFIYGDQLKLMAGVEYGLMKNSTTESFSGVTLQSGVRFSF